MNNMFKNDVIFNLLILIGLPLVGATLAIVIPISHFINPYSDFFLVGSLLLTFGWFLLAYSKWPQIKNGELFKFGPPKGPGSHKRNYAISYCMMVFGIVLIFSAR